MTISSKARFEQFSDGVFAIAITLLAFGLRIPHLENGSILGAVHELGPYIPNILTFVLSFFTIAIFWVNHHQLTQEIGPLNRRMIWMNMLLLFFVTLIPFVIQAATLNASHPLAILTFSLVLFGGSACFSLLRYFVHKSLDEKRVRISRSLIGPVLYLIAALACFVSVWLAYFFILIPPLYYFLPKSRT